MLGIPVQGLKSCQVVYSLRRPVFFFPSDVKRGEFNAPAAVAEARFPPTIAEINVILLPVTITPDLLLLLDKQISCFPLSLETTQARVPPVDLSG